METITTYQGNIQYHKVSENSKSKFPKSKIAAVAMCAFTLTNVNIAISQQNNGLYFSTKNKREIIEITNEKSTGINKLTFDNEEEGGSMTEMKLNEVQQYFDEKISKIKDTVSGIDTRTAVIENELKHIQKDIKEIPNVIKSTLLEIESEKAKNKKNKFWDRYGAPIITGIIVAVITTAGPFLLSIWTHAPKK